MIRSTRLDGYGNDQGVDVRRMSFAATVEQMRARSKTVTRRSPDTWRDLRPGDRLLAVEKAMGLAKGQRQVPIGVIEVVSNRVERLAAVGQAEARLEGFESLGGFICAWRRLHGRWESSAKVRRIEFIHIDDEAAP